MVTDSVSDVNAVVVPLSVDEPDAVALVEPASSAPGSMGPRVTGQTATAVTRVHSCGASPMTLMRAVAVNEPVMPWKSTRKFGVCPVVLTGSVERLRSTPGVSGTSVQPVMFAPDEFCTVSFALVNPLVGVSRVKDDHSWIAEVAEQPMRGTAVAPENVARCGAIALQPSSPVRMFTVLKTG
jgi:hypothetical protein